MKLETIKRKNKKQIIIGVMIVLSVVGCLTLTTTRAKYRNVQSLKIASGTVNYKASDLHIVAVKASEDGTNYTDQTEIPEFGYTFNAEKSKCRIPTSTLTGENAPADETIPMEYKDGRVYIGINKKNTKCYLYFDKIQGQTSSTIIAAIEASASFKSGTPDFTQVATGAETDANNGIFETDDPMYGTNAKTYYWRGAATTNHVIFDNKCWRIVRINGDGSIRLIYNGTPTGNICPGNGSNANSVVLSATAYNQTSNNSSYVGWSYIASNQRPSVLVPQTSGTRASLRVTLEDTWYKNNITEEAKKKIAIGKYCNDRNIGRGTYSATGASFDYAPLTRNETSSSISPTLSCSDGDVYQLSVGMITADEVTFAGASGNKTDNRQYYLYNGQEYWTMSPNYWNAGGHVDMFVVYMSGHLSSTNVRFVSNLRPVINLRSDVTFNAGSDGTQNNPYIVQ